MTWIREMNRLEDRYLSKRKRSSAKDFRPTQPGKPLVLWEGKFPKCGVCGKVYRSAKYVAKMRLSDHLERLHGVEAKDQPPELF